MSGNCRSNLCQIESDCAKAVLTAVETAIRRPAEGEEIICEHGIGTNTLQDKPAVT